ncbi:putative surface domain protein [Halolamina pelagica]|uniref:Putative surface domain protein n=1 Tax=Halolamina pelagica TaxID=699431 RepID=A0A0P7HYI7_9EURY|nr:putative surface domain protein [Halolamina pelagica]
MHSRLAETSALAVAALLVLSATAPGAVAGVGATADAQSASFSTTDADFVAADSFVNTSQNVSVWERAALPLRVDTSTATTTVEGPTTQIYTDETGLAPINKDTVGVFEPGSTITLEFNRRVGAGTDQFDGQNVQLVAARVSDNPNTSNLNTSATMGLTANEALDRLFAQNRTASEVNRNFTFTVADTGTIDSEGTVTTSFTPSEPGAYALMLVASDSGQAVSVSNGNASISEDVRILGVDAAPVQAASATATPQQETIDPGENVTFDVNSNLADERTSHTVVLVNESVLAGEETTINYDGDLDTLTANGFDANNTADNVTIEHSIDAIDGVARVDSDSQVMGINLADRSRSGTVGLPALIEFLATESNVNEPATSSTGDTVLNASTTSVVTESGSTTLEVGTSKNWTNGTYEYVYVASTNDTNEFSTAKGNITVGTEPREVQLDLTANRTNVEVPQAIRFTVRGDGQRIANAEITLGSQTVSTNANGRATIRPGEVGNFTATVTKADTDDVVYLSDTVDITVTEAPGEGGGGPPAGGGGGGGQGGGDEGGEARAIATNTGATVNFRSTRSGQPLSVDVPNVAADNAAVTGLTLTTRFSESNFRVEFTKPQAGPPSRTPELDPAQGTAVNYFTAEAIGLSDERIGNVKFTFTLSESELGDRSPDDVRLFRYVDGEWTTLKTTHLGGDEYRARSPGFTAYAIGFVSQQDATDTPTETMTMTPTPSDDGTATPTDTATVTPTDTPGGDGGGGIGGS